MLSRIQHACTGPKPWPKRRWPLILTSQTFIRRSARLRGGSTITGGPRKSFRKRAGWSRITPLTGTKSRGLSPTSGVPDFGLAQVYLAKKEYDRALQYFLRIPEKQRQAAIYRFSASSIYAGLGKKEEALDELEKAFEEGYRDSPAIDASPHLAALRSDPRFQQLLRRYRK